MKMFAKLSLLAVLVGANIALYAPDLTAANDRYGQCEVVKPGECQCVTHVTEQNCILDDDSTCGWSYLCNPQ